MTVNVISTANGLENEGMRNIATHIIKCGESYHKIRKSPLSNPLLCLINTFGADAVVIFARANGKTARLAAMLRGICKNITFVLVQRPEESFIQAAGKGLCRYSYLAISERDGEEAAAAGATVTRLPVGIDTEKFRPPKSTEEIRLLREKYSLTGKPLVLHVGHLSRGRGLESLLRLSGDKYHRLVVASGMFTDPGVRERLLNDGVVIVEEYVPDIGDVYRMADVYLFPTRSNDYVISVPLSVMESLACGTPVVTVDGVEGIETIPLANAECVVRCGEDELDGTISAIAEKFPKPQKSLLCDPPSWDEVAKALFDAVGKGNA